jgi:hypothetical protein
MKANIFLSVNMVLGLMLFMISISSSQAQGFKHLRYDEDYSHLRDSSELSWYEQVKFARLNTSGTAYFSFGGEVRYQYFKFENEEWGDAPKDSDGFLLNRLLLHGDLHLTKRIRIFGQLQSSIAVGRIDPSPVESNELELHQIFVDVNLLQADQTKLVLRVGRQELNYGSSRLISTREGPNNRQSFDGGKLFYVRKSFKADVFYSDYVASRPGIFNDDFFTDKVKFGGVYVALNHVPVVKNVDLYYLGQRKSAAKWNDVSGREERHSVGSRIWGTAKRWSYDVEGLLQFGDIHENTIRAWTLSANTAYKLGAKDLSPSIGVKTELISGDDKPGDGRIESFNPLYPRGAYFGYAALIGPSNLFDLHPSFDIPLSKIADLSVDYDIFWRYSGQDGIYSPGTGQIYAAGPTDSRFIGHQVSAALELNPNRFIYFRLETTWFKAGTYLRDVGNGKDIFYTGVTATLRF